MFGVGLEEIFVILLIFLMFIHPDNWKKIIFKIGYYINKINSEINELKNEIKKED